MTSKIKVDNINKVSDDSNIIKKCGTTTTIGSGASNPIVVDGSAVTIGRCGGTVALASGATQTGFGRTGTVDWQTGSIKTSTFTATSGEGYFVNTTAGAVTVNLPAGVAGAIVAVADYANTADTNKITIAANGSDKIQGSTTDFEITVEGGSVTLVFVDSTQGWRPTDASTASSITELSAFICGSVSGACNTLTTAPCCSNVKIATFLGPGTFTVNSGSGAKAKVDYLVIAGGGGGGSTALPVSSHGGSGGGAGGYRFTDGTQTGSYTAAPSPLAPLGASSLQLSPGAFPITVGGGGAGLAAQADPSTGTPGTNGANSIFSTITSTGGGGGGTRACTPFCGGTNGSPGGSGGGSNTGSTPGLGNTPPVTPPQGNDGGNTGQRGSPGGGGIGGVGANGEPSGAGGAGGNGGSGASSSITGSSVPRGGGGGGSGTPAPGSGQDGGGNGGYPPTNATSATINTGGGGGGGTKATSGSPSSTGGNGGSGIVVIRYKFQ